MYEYNPHRQNPLQCHHDQHHFSRHDVYTISNPMMFHHQHQHTNDDAMRNKVSRTPSHPHATMQLNECLTDSNPSEGGNGMIDHTDGKRRAYCRRFKLKYFINTVLLTIVLVLCLSVELGYIAPTKQSYICKDPKLSYKYNGDTIRISVLVVVCLVLPVITFLGVELLRNGRNWKKIIGLMWRWTKIFIIGNLIINIFIIEVLKSVIGEPRPHFFDTCTPNYTDCQPGEVVENYRCTNTMYSSVIIQDSSMSFPSGHSAMSVYTSVYCVAYIYYRMRFYSLNLGSLCKPFTIAVFMLWGSFCAVSRITDKRHHWWDVVVGCIIGTINAFYMVYGIAKKFQVEEKHTHGPSLSSIKLCDDNKDELV